MKKIITICVAFLITASVFAQAPEKMSYQAVVRNGSGVLVASSNVGIRIQILQGSQFGAAVYVETHTATTNANGLASLEIGGGTPVTGSFVTIDWSAGPYFIKTETDPTGGTSYAITGTSQLLSVPYALYAKSAGNIMTPVGFFAKQTVGSVQSIGGGSTTISFNSEDFDSGNNFNTTTSEFIVPESGVYHFDAVIDFYFGTETTSQLVLFGVSVNGTLKYFTKLQGKSVGDNYSGVMTTNLNLNSGDVVKLVAQKLNTGNVDASGSGNGGNYFTGYRVY